MAKIAGLGHRPTFGPRIGPGDNCARFLQLSNRGPLVKLYSQASGKEGPFILSKDDDTIIFVKWFRHWRTGKIIRAKNGKAIPLRLKSKK